jgi:hypothetical protein
VAVGPYELTASELSAVLAADRAGLPYLVWRTPDGDLVLRPLLDDAQIVGRSPDADVALPWDGEVSRAHVRLERVAGQWTLLDDGLSRNGTLVGGDRLQGRRRLRTGDVVLVGRTALVYRAPTEQGDDTVAARDGASAASLTPGERRVLVALCRPLLESDAVAVPASNHQIATELHLSVPGVKTQIRALFARLEVDDLAQNLKRAELARRAVASGLVTAGDLADRSVGPHPARAQE